VSGSGDNTIRVWDPATGQQVGEALRGHEDLVYSVAFSPDGTRIVSGSFDKTIRVWDAATGQQVSEALRGHEDWVSSVVFSPDGTCIVSGSNDKTIRVWDAATGQQVGGALGGDEDLITPAVFSADDMRIVSGSHDNMIRMWDVVNTHLTRLRRQGHWFCFSKTVPKSCILWIPHSLRHQDFIWHPCNLVITVRPKTTVRFEEAAWGPDWAKIKK
jgi:WD40 repeat protein